ncbi:phenazine biosynthesis protein [Salinigranum rubrum]|uniref:Phenazine biosynthesis protein n=1 Tax=Salinigranum rubrum TaxID=755307 RepID=A0A2I8VF22_9EURY|nr:PhzF family phenazine biosynthesis protein [Salinigranum rubrum]AUV80528.1 phenazine biosynthesis protein [Salinigranum rubrum]
MSLSHRFHLVDVFAEEPYAGNQLAVFHDTADLSTAEMQALTREMNYSESTFIESTTPPDDRYEVRIFDPAEELQFAGHPTIGTAYVVREFLRDDAPDELTLSLGVGDISVTVESEGEDDRYWVHQIPPSFETTLDHAHAAEMLGLSLDDIDDRYPVELVSTGLPTLVVPLRSLDAAQRAETQADPYSRYLVEPHGNVNLLVFTPETEGDTDLHVRVFADAGGIPEDPATGSSNGCLAAYLVAHRYFDTDEVSVTVEQGLEMGRPSLLHLRANESEEGITVSVGGRVQPVAEGRLL